MLEEKLDLDTAAEPDQEPGVSVLVPTPRRTIKKPVETLGMKPKENGGRFTALQRKLYFALMFYAQKQGWTSSQTCFSAPLAQVLDKVEYNSKNMAPVRAAFVSMVSTAVEWQSPTSGEGAGPAWGAAGLLASVQIHSKPTGSVIEWEYASSIRKHILKPERYASASLEVQQVLKSYPALVLYDICVRYADNARPQTPPRPWEWWKPVLTGGSDGLDIEPQFKSFNRDVLKKAVAEVNLKTPINIELVIHKSGKRVTDLQFAVSRKKNFVTPLGKVKSTAGLKEIGRAIAAGISQQQAELFLEGHGESDLSKGLDKLEERQSRQSLPSIRKPDAYLNELLKNHPLDSTTGLLANIKNETAVEKQKRLQLREEYLAERIAAALALFYESPSHEQADLRKRFEAETVSKLPASTRTMYEKKGLQAAAIKALFKTFLAVHFFGPQWNMPTDEDLARYVIRQA